MWRIEYHTISFYILDVWSLTSAWRTLMVKCYCNDALSVSSLVCRFSDSPEHKAEPRVRQKYSFSVISYRLPAPAWVKEAWFDEVEPTPWLWLPASRKSVTREDQHEGGGSTQVNTKDGKHHEGGNVSRLGGRFYLVQNEQNKSKYLRSYRDSNPGRESQNLEW